MFSCCFPRYRGSGCQKPQCAGLLRGWRGFLHPRWRCLRMFSRTSHKVTHSSLEQARSGQVTARSLPWAPPSPHVQFRGKGDMGAGPPRDRSRFDGSGPPGGPIMAMHVSCWEGGKGISEVPLTCNRLNPRPSSHLASPPWGSECTLWCHIWNEFIWV